MTLKATSPASAEALSGTSGYVDLGGRDNPENIPTSSIGQAARFIASRFRLTLPIAIVIADAAGLGGRAA